jgi:hypothetical protein
VTVGTAPEPRREQWRHRAAATPLVAGIEDYTIVDIDDTIVEVHGYAKQPGGPATCLSRLD